MKTIKEMIEVMKAFDEGKKIEFYSSTDKSWYDCTPRPSWQWGDVDYRIKPEHKTRPMTLEEIIDWRKNSNGVILWGKEITTVETISTIDNGIIVAGEGWQTLTNFVSIARKPCGEKFEITEE